MIWTEMACVDMLWHEMSWHGMEWNVMHEMEWNEMVCTELYNIQYYFLFIWLNAVTMCQDYSYKRSYRLFAHFCSEMLTANNKSWQYMVAISHRYSLYFGKLKPCKVSFNVSWLFTFLATQQFCFKLFTAKDILQI